MNNEEKIIELLQGMQADISGIHADIAELKTGQTRLETRIGGLETRMGGLEQKVSDMDEVLAKTALVQENEVIPKLQLVLENQAMIIETCAKKGDVDALREDLGLQKFRIDVITDKLMQG